MKKNYRKRLKTMLLGGLLSFMLTGCTDWLQVENIDKITESMVFSSESSVNAALNGIYIKMGTSAMYGRDLSIGMIDLLAQQYGIINEGQTETLDPLKYYTIAYNLTTSETRSKILSIWRELYGSILNVNNFIEQLEKSSGVVTPSKKDILLGEAYGLRAFLHLDLLRMFGPVYSTDSTGLSIPYRNTTKIEYNERIAATKVMDNILIDLDKSILLLDKDPVRTEGPMVVVSDSLTVSQKEIDSFYRYRNRRMNYYAAMTLKVRALMWRGDKSAAAGLAKTLLEAEAISEKFPWSTNAEVTLINREDRIFSKEVLFGLYSPNMYSLWTSKFAQTVSEPVVYATLADNLKKIYDVEIEYSTDLRARNWSRYHVNDKYLLSFKLSKSTLETLFWYYQPMIRKTELYYALAESEQDLYYLNEIRTNRSLLMLTDISQLDAEIEKDFIREMINEGQIFYFFKRKAKSSIQSGKSASATVKPTYVIPIPQEELDK